MQHGPHAAAHTPRGCRDAVLMRRHDIWRFCTYFTPAPPPRGRDMTSSFGNTRQVPTLEERSGQATRAFRPALTFLLSTKVTKITSHYHASIHTCSATACLISFSHLRTRCGFQDASMQSLIFSRRSLSRYRHTASRWTGHNSRRLDLMDSTPRADIFIGGALRTSLFLRRRPRISRHFYIYASGCRFFQLISQLSTTISTRILYRWHNNNMKSVAMQY